MFDEMLGRISPASISMNPGAIHILKALPHLIDKRTITCNPKFSQIIREGLISIDDVEWSCSTYYNDPELVKIIGENLHVLRKIRLTDIASNCNYLLEPVSMKKVITNADI